MKIDLFKLNNFNKVEIDENITFDESLFGTTDIRNILNSHVSGEISIGYDDDIYVELEVTGTFILPCAITLEDVSCDFKVNIDENIGKFEDFYNKSKNSLDILPVIWENIVSEVPIKVVKEGIDKSSFNGNGWELVSED